MFPKKIWYLYDNTSGNVVLKHPYSAGISVPCPQCQRPLEIQNYRATCCGKTFKTSFGEISQRERVGEHHRQRGRGWDSLRPYEST